MLPKPSFCGPLSVEPASMVMACGLSANPRSNPSMTKPYPSMPVGVRMRNSLSNFFLPEMPL
ncbi:hypothetical protein [Candidimonas nitroreducens]|uniref:hypothetical protein n=1 Tax=Candidimonas nitroreducens TaxID=683354 RepID=UPI001E62DB6B|nr:hypothetical protein [Candidimonas nitroreducens]